MQVGEIMKTTVRTAPADATVADVASLLRANGISSAIVMEGDALAGIMTERDIVSVVAEGLDPREVRVGERMSRDLDTVESRTDIAEAAEHMARLGIRHLPIVDRGTVVGIISIRDLTNWAVEELAGGHELADLRRSQSTLSAAAKVNRTTT
jgi:CBS domain-containing protein